MWGSKLAELLKGISPGEYKKFGEYLNSPFFNKSRRIIKLYNYFKRKSSFGKSQFSKESMWKYLYPDKLYNDQITRALISKFVRLTEDFLVQMSFLSKLMDKKTLLTEELWLRGAHKCFETESKSLLTRYKYNRLFDESRFENLIHLENLTLTGSSGKLKLVENTNIADVLKTIDYQFIYSKLYSCNLLLIEKSPLPKDYMIEYGILGEIIKRMGDETENLERNNKLIFLEYLILNMLIKFENLEYTELLLDFLKENNKKLDFAVLNHIFYSFDAWHICICNCCSNEKYKLKMFDILKFFDDIRFFDNYKPISQKAFYNVIETSFQAGKGNFAQKFYYRNIYKIDRQKDRDFIILSKVILNINRRNFKTAIGDLHKMSLKDSESYLLNKSYLAQIFYQTEETEPLNYLIDATVHYLNRNKFNIGLRYNSYHNFFNCIHKLNNSNRSTDLMELRKSMTEDKPVFDKKWLLEKVRILQENNCF